MSQRIIVDDRAIRGGYRVPASYRLVIRVPEYRRSIYYAPPTLWLVQLRLLLIRYIVRYIVSPILILIVYAHQWLRSEKARGDAFRSGYVMGKRDGRAEREKDFAEAMESYLAERAERWKSRE